MAVTDLFARRATLRRSARLLSEFRYEQSDPARFYGAVAADTADMVTDLWQASSGDRPAGRTVVDVGGGPGTTRRRGAARARLRQQGHVSRLRRPRGRLRRRGRGPAANVEKEA